jgi:hypothetical protein
VTNASGGAVLASSLLLLAPATLGDVPVLPRDYVRDMDKNLYAERLAHVLHSAAQHGHVVPDEPWRREPGSYAFDVELCDADDLRSGFVARVVVTVSEA